MNCPDRVEAPISPIIIGKVYNPDIAGLTPEFVFKFALAQAVLTEPSLLLIDEIPNALLDGAVGRILKRLIGESGKRTTVIFVSHRTDYLALAERVVALRYGKVPVVSTPATLLARFE